MEKILYIAACLIAICVLSKNLMMVSLPYYSNQNLKEQTCLFGEITDEIKLIQKIPIEKAIFLDKIGIQFATYGRTLSSNIQVALYSQEQSIFQREINAFHIKDNEIYYMENVNYSVPANETLTLEIASNDAAAGEALTVWIKPGAALNGHLFKYNASTDETELLAGEISIVMNEKVRTSEHLSNRYLGLPPTIIKGLYLVFMILVGYLFYMLYVTNVKGEI